jgi:hypothetical protein
VGLVVGCKPVYGLRVATIEVSLNDVQRAVAIEVALALGDGDWTALRLQLATAESNKVWLSPPLLAVAAALMRVITDASTERPWPFTDDLWDRYLPDAKPVGASQWRKASLATQAAGCLAGGVWLDVGASESYWRQPFWLDVIDVIDLLRRVAEDVAGASGPELAERALQALALTRPTAPLD